MARGVGAVAGYGDVSVVVAGVGVDCYGAHVCLFRRPLSLGEEIILNQTCQEVEVSKKEVDGKSARTFRREKTMGEGSKEYKAELSGGDRRQETPTRCLVVCPTSKPPDDEARGRGHMAGWR